MRLIPERYGRLFALVFLVLIAFLLPSGTLAADSGGNIRFVYGTNHFNGVTYSSALIPPAVDNVYLLADETSMVAARFTEVYYWPLTNEYKANWDKANVNVDGTLEIIQNGRVLQSLSRTRYVIQYDYYDKVDTIRLYTGDDAVAARKRFEEKQAKYRDGLYQYYQKLNAYQAAYQSALTKLQKGEISAGEMPIPPQPLKDLSLFSTNLLWGFPVDLPAGNYTIRLRLPDGTIQPDSEKTLTVFEAIRDGIGYSLVAAERWNSPERSNEESEVVYSLKGETVYIQPWHQKQYNQLFYMRMNAPQDDKASREKEIWVPFRQADDYTLQVECRKQTDRLALKEYFVKQKKGAKLGYDIVPFDPANMEKATFSAFEFSPKTAGGVCQWYCVDAAGREVPMSRREYRILKTDNGRLIVLVSFLPMLIGLGAVYLRRKQVRKLKVIDG